MEATRLNMGTHWNACMSKICRQSLQRQRGSTFTSLPLHFHHFHHLCGCEASHVAVTIHNLCSYNYVHLKNSRNLISLHTGHIFNFMPLSNSMIVWLLVSAMHLYGLLCPTYNAPQMGSAREILYEYYQSGMFLLLGAFLFTYSYCEHWLEEVPCQVTWN